MGRVRVFCSEAFFSSEVRHERSCRGGHQLLPPKVCRSLWILSDAGLHLLQVNHANSVVKFLREAQGNQVMKRIFFLSILKHRLGQIHLQLSFLHVMILIRSRKLELTPIAVAGVMLGSFGFICTRLRFDEPMNSNILQGFSFEHCCWSSEDMFHDGASTIRKDALPDGRGSAWCDHSGNCFLSNDVMLYCSSLLKTGWSLMRYEDELWCNDTRQTYLFCCLLCTESFLKASSRIEKTTKLEFYFSHVSTTLKFLR